MDMDYTRKFDLNYDKDDEIKTVLTTVYNALQEKGYNPINQIVGYILPRTPLISPIITAPAPSSARSTGTSCCRPC